MIMKRHWSGAAPSYDQTSIDAAIFAHRFIGQDAKSRTDIVRHMLGPAGAGMTQVTAGMAEDEFQQDLPQLTADLAAQRAGGEIRACGSARRRERAVDQYGEPRSAGERQQALLGLDGRSSA